MTGPEITPNFDNMIDLRTIVCDAEAVPVALWNKLQDVHRESLRSHVPQSEWGRVDDMVGPSNRARYRETRVDPGILVREKVWNPQLLNKVLVAVTFDDTNQPISGVITENSTSASIPKRLNEKLDWSIDEDGRLAHIERWLKMATPAGLKVPYMGDSRVVHVREGYIHPDVQPGIDWEQQASGIILAGLRYTLAEYHKRQWSAAYIFPNDPIDIELTQTSKAVGMTITGDQRHGIPSFDPDEPIVRVRRRTGEIIDYVEKHPDAPPALGHTAVSKLTHKEAQSARKAEDKQRHRDDKRLWWAEQDSKHFTK